MNASLSGGSSLLKAPAPETPKDEDVLDTDRSEGGDYDGGDSGSESGSEQGRESEQATEDASLTTEVINGSTINLAAASALVRNTMYINLLSIFMYVYMSLFLFSLA